MVAVLRGGPTAATDLLNEESPALARYHALGALALSGQASRTISREAPLRSWTILPD